MKITIRRALALTAVLVVTAGGLATPAAASPARVREGVTAATLPPVIASKLQYQFTKLAKAKPDECFAGIGMPYPPGPPCKTGKAKVNQAYVWGLTQVGKLIWFGTGANVMCLVSGATLSIVKPYSNDDYTCEYGDSQAVKDDAAIPPEVGDMRAPEVWTYDPATHKAFNKSAEIRAKGPEDTLRLAHTIGLRAAGTFGNVVLLGGPALENTLNMFAFDATTKQYLGSFTFTQFGNIRTFLVAQNALYLGVGIGRNGGAGGAVLRWQGSTTDPFNFATVATLPVQAADLTVYGDRIAATSWPADKPTTQQMLAGLWLSPNFAEGTPGLNAEDATKWTNVWNAKQYEPDRVMSATYGGGGIATLGDYVYWGTMHVPMKASTAYAQLYPPVDDAAAKAQVKNTQRAITIWRGKDLGLPTQKIELLYGETELPVYDTVTSTWAMKPTNWTPLYGKSGFGNFFNNYTWRMTVVDNRLYVGTMDWSYLVKDLIKSGTPEDTSVNKFAKKAMADDDWTKPLIKPGQFGGDMYVFNDTVSAALPVNTRGLGNYLNYGIRNMIPNGKGGLYVGMANPMNLRTSATDGKPDGGWELLEMNKRATR